MEACYYCGAPLKQGSISCRFCGTAVDPLDVPLCDSENNIILDEAPVLQISDVKYPSLLSYDDIIQSETGMETVTFSKVQSESSVQETTPAEPEVVSDVPETISEDLPIISGAEASSKNNDEQASPEQAEHLEKKAIDEESQKTAENEPDKGSLFSINVLPEQDQSCVIIKYLGGQADSLLIPDEIDGLQVKEIGRSAFAHCDVREIVLSESIQRIRDYAFTGCISLQSIVGGAGVREIGRGVFNGCLHLKRCDFLRNRRIQRPFDTFIDKIVTQLNVAAKADKGES